jgi:hypothetical protein
MKGVSGGHGAGDVDHLGMLAQIRQHLGVFHEHAETAFVQGLAWALGPFLEPVLGQQVTAIQLGRRPKVLRVPGLVGSPARGFERIGVQPRHCAFRQQHHVVAQAQGSGRPGECPAGDVQRLMQVVGGRCPIAVRPQHSHQGFAVQPMAAGKSQQLHQRLGLTQAPGVGGHRTTSHGDLESTEEPDPHACVVSHYPALPCDGSLPPQTLRAPVNAGQGLRRLTAVQRLPVSVDPSE